MSPMSRGEAERRVRIVNVTQPPRVYVRGYIDDRPFLYREREQVASLRIGAPDDVTFPTVFSRNVTITSTAIPYPSVTEEEWSTILFSLLSKASSAKTTDVIG